MVTLSIVSVSCCVIGVFTQLSFALSKVVFPWNMHVISIEGIFEHPIYLVFRTLMQSVVVQIFLNEPTNSGPTLHFPALTKRNLS